MQRGRNAADLQDASSSEVSALMSSSWASDVPERPLGSSHEQDDEDVYGAPSEDEMDHTTHSHAKQASKNPFRPSSADVNEDDVPLGSRASLDIRAAHERIIQQEKQAQSNKTLRILEGKASPKKAHQIPLRSQTLPRRWRHGPQAYASERPNHNASHQPSSSDPSTEATSRKMYPLQRSVTGVKKKGSLWNMADPRSRTSSADTHANKIVTDKAALESQMREVTMAMAQLSSNRSVPQPQPSLPPLRVFFQNVQKYTMVPMVDNAMVITVLHHALAQNGIAPHSNTFDTWALYDVIPEWGLERPLREYERIEDIVRARGRDSGYFLIKPFDRYDLLRTDSIPPFSSVLGGSVSILLEQGKWCKKWLELREHSLYIAKDEKVRPHLLTCRANQKAAFSP